MASVLEVRDKVGRYLTSRFNGVNIDKDGDFSFRVDSTRVFVRVTDWRKDQTVIRVFAPILIGAPLTQELKDYVALEGGKFVFGGISLQVDDKDSVAMFFYHSLLGDYLDEPELLNSCFAVGATADKLDDELQTRFGGKKFHE